MADKIKVLHVVHNMGLGGYENYLMNIFRKLDKNNFEFTFLVFKKEKCYFEDEINELGGRVFHCSFGSDHKYFKARKELKEFINENHFDILHCHCHYYSFLFLKDFSKKIKTVILHSHSSKREHTLKGSIVYLLSKYPSRKRFNNLACSKVAGEFFYGKNGTFSLCPNCIETDRFVFNEHARNALREKYDIDQKTLVLGSIGRFIKQKNQRFLLDVAEELIKRNIDFKLCLCGEGVLKNSLHELVSKDKDLYDKVIFLETGSVEDYYSMFDIFTLPSISEGFPLTLLESQATGCYSIASKNITNEVLLTDKIVFLDIDDPITWADKIETVQKELSYDRKALNKVIKESQYDSNKACEFLMNYYLEVLKK